MPVISRGSVTLGVSEWELRVRTRVRVSVCVHLCKTLVSVAMRLGRGHQPVGTLQRARWWPAGDMPHPNSWNP